MFLELHIIQNFPPTCLNRDQANLPKETYFGGVRRARVSSQSWKKAIRDSEAFEAIVGANHIGDRTKNLVREVVRQLTEEANKYKKQEDLVIAVSELVGHYVDPKKGKAKAIDKESGDKNRTTVQLFWSKQEIARIGAIVDQRWAELLPAVQKHKGAMAAKALREAEVKKREEEEIAKALEAGKKYKKPTKTKKEQKQEQDEFRESALGKLVKEMVDELMNQARSKRQGVNKTVVDAVDIALYGRMVASNQDLEIDAATQFGHAISTHAVEMETDYFTAVDTLPFGDDQGADMIGQQDFNSSCFYRFACVDLEQLRDNLDGNEELTQIGIKGFMHAFFEAVPTAKKSAFDNNSQPSFALAVVRKSGAGWSLANAFDKPVSSFGEDGYIKPSVGRLDTQWQAMRTALDSVGEDGKSTKVKQVVMLKIGDISTPNLDNDSDMLATTSVDKWVKHTCDALLKS